MLSTGKVLLLSILALSCVTTLCTADQANCRNETSVLSKVLGLFDGREECKNTTTKIESGVPGYGTTAGRSGYGGSRANSTDFFVLNDNKPNLTKANTEDLIVYPSIDEFCDTTGTQPEKQRCCPVGQWLNKDGICQSLIH